ncbi:MAG: MFS transporter [Hyphomicrobiaceae bacterium]|nr:MFS transporter [Hyphomicrobiaceae bacterium]
MPSFLTPLLVVLVPLVGISSLHLFLPVVAPLMMEAAGVDATAFGWVAGASGLGSIWLYMSNHGLTPSLGPLRTLQVGTLIAVLGGALTMTASFPIMLAGAMLIGFGYSTSTPSGSQILAERTPKQHWSTIFSVRQAGVPLGGVVAGGFGGWLIGELGWRPAFLLIGFACLALSLPLLLAPLSYNTSRPLKQFRIATLLAPSNLRRPFRALRLAPGLVRLAVACMGFAIVQSAFFSFFVIYLHAGLGYGLALSGALFAVLQGASVIGRIAFGMVADRVGSPRPVLMVLAVCSSASALMLAGLGPGLDPLLLAGAALIAGGSVATWNGLYLAEVAALAPAESVSEATAGTTFFVFLTYTATPPVFAVLIDRLGYESAFIAAAFGAALSGVVLLLGRSSKPATDSKGA